MNKGKIDNKTNIEENFFLTTKVVGVDLRVSQRLKLLEKKVFVFKTSEADKKYFQNELTKLAKEGMQESNFNQFCWNRIYERNNGGTNCKYLYFNEHNQKLYVDRDFYEWAKLTLDEIEKLIEKNAG